MKTFQRKEDGAILLLTLVILLVLTLSVVAGLKDSISTQKMISSANAYQFSFELAEATMLNVFDEIESLPDVNAFGSKNGYYKKGTAPDPFSIDWETQPEVQMNDQLNVQPRYFIERVGSVTQNETQNLEVPVYGDLGNVGNAEVFRVVVKTTDFTDQSNQIIETFYARVM
jgi:type IV pilus assembly protein PilX